MFDLPRKRAPVVRCPDADGWCRDARDFPRTFPERERKKKKESRVRLLWRVCYFSRILVNGTEFTVDGSREGKLTEKTITTLLALLLRSKGGR